MSRHPYLELFVTVLFDLSVFAFTLLAAGREGSAEFRVLLPLAGLLLMGLFQIRLLKKPRTIGNYLLFCAVPALLVLILLIKSTDFLAPDTAHLVFFAVACICLLGRRLSLPLHAMEPVAAVLYADGTVALLILTRVVNHYLPRQGFDAVALLLTAALAAEIMNLLADRMAETGERGAKAGSLLVIGGLLIVFFLLAAVSVLRGEAVSAWIVGVVKACWRAVTGAVLFAGRLLLRFIEWLVSFLPEPEGGAEVPEPWTFPGIGEMEAGWQPDLMKSVIIVLAAAALAVILLVRHFLHLLAGGTGGRKKTAPGERRSSCFGRFLRELLTRFRRFFRAVFTVLFRADSVPALLYRAEWYGRRRLAGRKKHETVREYLTRIGGAENGAADAPRGGEAAGTGAAAGAAGMTAARRAAALRLAELADLYLYGSAGAEAEAPADPAEAKIIKRAFPLF